MNNNLSPFQMFFFGILVVIIVTSVSIFALQRTTGGGARVVEVDMWGTIDSDTFFRLQSEINTNQKNALVNINYREIPENQFESVFVEALASGNGPDLVLIPDFLFVKQENKLYEIPYQTFPQQTFKNTFVEGSEFLLSSFGIKAFPYILDPMVMYWNRTLLNQAGISLPPTQWEQFTTMTPSLVVKDTGTSAISKAAVALGEFRNVNHAKEILINLIQQAGNPVIVREYLSETSEAVYSSILPDRQSYAVAPVNAALNFFTQFSNPTREIYSWNRALPQSQDMFLSNDLAFYFGFASEYNILRQKNPNLNFDVSVMPQSGGTEIKSVLGKMHVIGVVKNSKKINPAITTAQNLTSFDSINIASKIFELPPVRRDLLVAVPESSIKNNFNASALISKIFLDPNREQTNLIFTNMVESYVSGRASLSEAVSRADSELKNLLTR
jgi:ABC-type glycerol-3-phosphate transport system substrate-binding protein